MANVFLGFMGFIIFVLVTVGCIFAALDKIVDSRDKEAVRSKVEAFWFRTAALEGYEQFRLALQSRYTQMRNVQKLYLSWFIWIAVIFALVGAVRGALVSTEEFVRSHRELIARDFDVRQSIEWANLETTADDEDPDFGNVDGQCTVGLT